jgi:CHAT domain-containing protein
MYNLANLYVDQGRYDEAENLYNRSLKIEEAAYGPMDDGVALTIEHLAILYSMQGRHEEAGPLHLRAFDIFEQVFGADHPLMAILLTNLGNFNQDQGNYGEAERLYGEAMKIARDALGDEHPLMVTVKVNLASLYSEVKRYSEAEALFLDAYETAIRTLGPKHPDMAYVSEAFGGYHRTRKSLRESMDLSLRAFDIRARHFEENGFVLSERDALKHSENLRPPMGIYLSSYFDSRTEDQDAREMAVDMVLRAKGRVSDLILERRNVIASAADPTISAMVADLRDTRLRLSDLYVQGPEDDDFTAYRTALDSLGRVANTIESDLAMESEAFRRMMDTRETSAGRLCPLLPESCVLLEYFKYDYLAYDPDSTISSYLLVALGSDGVLDMMDLGGASKLDSVVISYREHMLGVSSMDHMPLDEDCRKYESVAGELYRLVVGPIEKHLEGKRLLLVAPDGSLNLVSFAALVDSRGGYLVETIPVHYLSAARDLTWLDRGAEPGRGLLAFGDPDYDAGLEDGEAVSEAISDSGVRSVPLSTRGAVSSSLAASEAGPLPHTRSEIENISRYWEGHGDGLSRIFLGRDATEENFKTSAPGMLHIYAATHGFYREGHMNPRSTASQSALDIEFSGENPLLLSGLLLAGANVRPLLAAATGCEDGVLTAYEVSTIDLSRADMVVLSACETGLGKVYEGEGVYGLRRAFRMAGACTIVSALWPVSDEATTDVMAELYAESAVSIPERIRAMQLSRIARLRSEGLPDHPYTWAPFIAIGVWE